MVKIKFLEVEIQNLNKVLHNCYTIATPDRKGLSLDASSIAYGGLTSISNICSAFYCVYTTLFLFT